MAVEQIEIVFKADTTELRELLDKHRGPEEPSRTLLIVQNRHLRDRLRREYAKAARTDTVVAASEDALHGYRFDTIICMADVRFMPMKDADRFTAWFEHVALLRLRLDGIVISV